MRRPGATSAATAGFLVVVVLAMAVGTVAGRSHADVDPHGRARPASTGELLQHNLVVLAVVAVLALLSVGLLAVLYLLPSFWLVGFQVGQSWRQHGLGATLDGLVWHAPFELAAFALGAGSSAVLSARLWSRALGGGGPGRAPAPGDVVALLRGWTTSLVLLVLAALVEATASAGR